MTYHRMSKKDLIEFLTTNQKMFVFFFCVLFGVIAQESYQILKNENRSTIKKFIPKSIVALFVCVLVSGFLQENKFLNKYYPFVIMGLAFLYRPASDWIMTDLLPFLSKQLIKNQKQKEDE